MIVFNHIEFQQYMIVFNHIVFQQYMIKITFGTDFYC
jgi:hypothetical protein